MLVTRAAGAYTAAPPLEAFAELPARARRGELFEEKARRRCAPKSARSRAPAPSLPLAPCRANRTPPLSIRRIAMCISHRTSHACYTCAGCCG